MSITAMHHSLQMPCQNHMRCAPLRVDLNPSFFAIGDFANRVPR